MTEKVVQLIIQTLQEFDEVENEELDKDTPLFGAEGILDSSGLASFVIAVEQAVEDEYDVSVTLADEKALSQTNSPFLTIGSLAEYADKVIQEEA